MSEIIMPVANAILKNGDNILILKRSAKSKYAPGFWQLPGGRLEFGETPMQALIREVKEETGCVFIPTNGKVVCVGSQIIELKGDKFQLLTLVYEGSINGKVTISDEHSESKWMVLEDVLKMNDLEEGTRKILLQWKGSE